MLDLRLPVGLFFLVIGAILSVYGYVHPVTAIGTTINLNLDWGLVMLVFGLVMTFFGGIAQRRAVLDAVPVAPVWPPPK